LRNLRNLRTVSGDKGKPIERWGRKITGLRSKADYGSQVTAAGSAAKRIFHNIF